MKNIAIPVLKIDGNFEIISWNTSAEDFLKVTFKKSPGAQLNLKEILPSGIWSEFQYNFEANGGVFHNIFTFSKTKNLEIFSSPCLDDGGNIKNYSLSIKVVSSRDTTSSENIIQLKNILENSSLAIFLTDPSGPIIGVNKAACRMFGYSAKEMTGLHREHIMQKNINLDNAVEHRNKAGELRSELIGVRKSGETFPCEVHSVIYTNNEGEKRTSTTIIDISERKKQELIAENNKQAFQSLFEYNPDAVYSFDLQGNFLSLNESAARLGETSREKLMEMSFLPLIPKDDQVRVMEYFAKATLGEVQRYQTNFIGLKGTRKVLDVTNFPIYVNKKIVGVYGIAKNITQQVSMEQKLLEDRNMFRAIIDYIPDHIFVVNEKHETILTNHSFYKNYLGVEDEQKSLGLTAAEFLDKEEANEILEDNTRVMDSGTPVLNREKIIHNFNGEKQYTLLTKVPFSFGDNKKGLVGISRNISEIKEKEKSLEELNQALKEHADELSLSNKELEQFAYIASHDLQEPLIMITSFLAQLKKKYEHELDEKAQQYIYFANDGAIRMRQIILDLLEYSRVGRIPHKVTAINLEHLVAEVLLLQKRSITEKNAGIEIGTLPELKVEEPLLKQLFSNLIENALKYSSKERTPEINISSLEKEKHWEFEIRDNGIGIEEEFREQIFIIFQRLHQRSEYKGTGIGLAICKKIVDNFGGDIWVDSTFGKGSSFYFTIPKQF
ncbi:PAS domain S-box-containing protein [Salegentibacter holothuriorum]|uniref:histidine kinase n=1 Tax=Salegentibacter holothuriorum TaxID=241145 RepID=A0A1T5ANR0_9FLAO|nr:PAS domain-containing sensor histidine kinase [Salegentibacter holothuriorum]SKB36505.1 PAS domain S-box-containing protein [Salegentibacter holothuriorum]